MFNSVVVMGVAGCGKSSLAALLAQSMGMQLLEGDEHHSPENRDKMRQGTALTDSDRSGWLADLALQLCRQPRGLVLTCSALRRSYRDQLREGAPGLRFVFLDIARAEAGRRVAQRAAHYFSANLVDSQFATLEPPVNESGVLWVNACTPPAKQLAEVSQWLAKTENI